MGGNGLLLIVTNLQTVHVQGRGGAGGTGGAGRTPGGDGGSAGDGGTATGTGHGGNGGRGGNGGLGARGGNGGVGGNGSNIQIVYRQQQVGVQVTYDLAPGPGGAGGQGAFGGTGGAAGLGGVGGSVFLRRERHQWRSGNQRSGLRNDGTAGAGANQEQRRLRTNHERSGSVGPLTGRARHVDELAWNRHPGVPCVVERSD